MQENKLNIKPENYYEYKNYCDEMIELDLQSHKKEFLKLILSLPVVAIILFITISTLLNINSTLFNIIATFFATSFLYSIDAVIFGYNLEKKRSNLMKKYQNINTEYDELEIEEALDRLVITNVLEYQTKKCEEARKEMIQPTNREYKAFHINKLQISNDQLEKAKTKVKTLKKL